MVQKAEDVDELMIRIQEDVHLKRGLQQRNLNLMPDKPGRTFVQFRKLSKARQEEEKNVPDTDVFNLELGYHDLFKDVVSRVADVLHVEHSRIRLARHECRSNKPSNLLICPQDAYLLDFLRTSNKICNVLYYIVLLDPSKQEISEIVDEVEACDRHEMQPQEDNHRTYRKYMVRLYHFTKTGGKVSKIPFIKIAYNADETLAEVKERLQLRVGIDKEDISKRKFAVLGPRGSIVYLEDTKVLYGCVKGKQTLGLEGHGDGSFETIEGTLE